jgi:hypothetical protein
MIYFIENDGLIKIGFTTNPTRRLNCLKTSNPGELITRLVIEGDLEDEKKFHELFKADNHRGKWFLFSDNIKEFILKNQSNDLRYDFGLLNNHNEIKVETTRIRNLFNLNLREMGEKLNLTAQSIKELEYRELMGAVSLNCLRKYARALDHHLVYKFCKNETDEIYDEDINS